MNFSPVFPVNAIGAGQAPAFDAAPRIVSKQTSSFGDMLISGIESTNAKVAEADRLTQAFVLDDSIPVHQVTFALEQARLSMELMLQVRGRLVEGYQQLMNMQL